MAQPTLSIRTLLAAPARAVIRAGLACLARWIDLPAHPHESAVERAVVISDGCHLPAQRLDLRSTGDTTGILSNDTDDRRSGAPALQPALAKAWPWMAKDRKIVRITQDETTLGIPTHA